MPFINVKLVKGQATQEQKKRLTGGITDLVVDIMGRERKLTVITVDEIDASNWVIGGEGLDELSNRIVSFVNIKVSKGTTNPEEMSKMMRATKELIVKVLGGSDETSYFIIDELNPDGWGFDGISMSERRRLEI